MIVDSLVLPEVLLIKPRVFRDVRGHLVEIWRESAYAEHGMGPFVQDNVSVSRRGVLRGLHLQHPHTQGKLASVLRGMVYDVAVDVRQGSPTFGKWAAAVLSAELGWQIYVPPGFAHGFFTLTDDVVFSYKCTEYYTPEAEMVVRWDDPAIGIEWPTSNPELSPRDRNAPLLSAIGSTALPKWVYGE
ncbi:MAG: dTDP-4-dehydrorhamnose 3,5-epimerase [Gemmatimonadota bacterium]